MPAPPSLLVVAGPPDDAVGLVMQLARALGYQIASGGPAASRLAGWLGTGDRVVATEPDLVSTLPAWLSAGDRLGVALAILVPVGHPGRDPETWLRATLGAAVATRGHARAVVRAEDIEHDWRTALSLADKQSGSRLIAGATLADLDDADDVYAAWPRADRVPTWPEDLPLERRDLAARAYVALGSVADGRGDLDFVDALWDEAVRR